MQYNFIKVSILLFLKNLLKINNTLKISFKLIKSGFFFDFFLKKIVEVFLKNFLIYSSLFFGEKFIIEFLTKRIIHNFIYHFNKKVGYNFINYKIFLLILVKTIFYILFFFNIFIIFF